jgi:hypothetical protein
MRSRKVLSSVGEQSILFVAPHGKVRISLQASFSERVEANVPA